LTDTTIRHRLAAILAADAAGYSRLMAADERATVAALDTARRVFKSEIESRQGRVIDMAGDSVLAVFETATGAVAAALAVQGALVATESAVPEARRMRFADGSVHAGYNMQVAAHPGSTIVVSIDATDRRNDSAQAGPMVDDMARRYGRTPKRLLVDTLYATQSDIVQLAEHPAGPVLVYAPLPKERPAPAIKPASLQRRAYERAREPEAIAQWRTRMAAPESDIVYRRRKAIELVHAQMKNRGFGRLTVRGLLKAKAVALWHALAHNLCAAHRLREAAA